MLDIWRTELAKINEKAGQSLADPQQYENLFPGFYDAVKTQQFLLPERTTVLPASAAINVSVIVTIATKQNKNALFFSFNSLVNFRILLVLILDPPSRVRLKIPREAPSAGCGYAADGNLPGNAIGGWCPVMRIACGNGTGDVVRRPFLPSRTGADGGRHPWARRVGPAKRRGILETDPGVGLNYVLTSRWSMISKLVQLWIEFGGVEKSFFFQTGCLES